jgi:predicted GNAT family acetyltransferase
MPRSGLRNDPICQSPLSSITVAEDRRARQEANRSMPMEYSVTENPAAHRFEMTVGDAVAAAFYRLEDGKVVLTHTEVPQELSGQGIGSKLAAGTFRLIRQSGRKAVIQCSFMAGWVSRHPEAADLIVG